MPAMQSVQESSPPLPSDFLPAAQLLQLAVDPSLYCPTEQATQDVDPLESSLFVPTPQASQDGEEAAFV